MQNLVTLPPPEEPWVLTKNVLNEASLNGELHQLAPGAELLNELPSPGSLVVFIASGQVTITSGKTNFILRSEQTLHLPAGSRYALRNGDATLAKVLVLALPPPQPKHRIEDLCTLK